MSGNLQGKRVAFLATDGFEQVELTQPWNAMKTAGAELHLISLKSGQIQGFHHDEKGDRFPVDRVVGEVRVADYDALVLPGGTLNPDALRCDTTAVEFVRGFFEQHKPVAAICHGPWTLVEAGVVDGRTLTSWPSLRTDIENAGGIWVDEECCVDQGLITSRNPGDLNTFCSKAIKAFAEGKHAGQHA